MTEYQKFRRWAEENGVNMKSSDDWEPWWACWHDGYKTAEKDAEKTK